MTWRNTKYNLVQYLAAVLLLSFCLSACGSGTTGDSGAVTPQGTIDLANLKVGVPEKVLEDSVLSFELDENPISRTGGKNQYLSRTLDSKGGKYLAQCKDGSCFQLQSLYLDSPITKAQAMETVKNMLPSIAPEQSKVEDPDLSAENPREVVFYGNDYYAEIIYSDKTAEKVQSVSVNDMTKLRDQELKPEAKSDEKAADDKGADAAKDKTDTK